MSESLFSRRLALFPQTSQEKEGVLTVSGHSLADLAQEYGTPLYIYDRATQDACVQDYRESLAEFYPGESGITYASKAFLCLAIAQWTQQHGLWLDCTGTGELATARAASVQRENVLVHGVNKNSADLLAAIAQAGTIVVDHLSELERLIELFQSGSQQIPQLWLRFRPGLAVQTHSYTQTGQDDSKFGMGADEIRQAVQRCLVEGLPLTGIHFHQGSHFHDPAPLGTAIDTTLDLILDLRDRLGWYPRYFCPGGGWGVPYNEDDLPHLPVSAYIQLISNRLTDGCKKRRLQLPHLQIEPGRSLIARAGIAVYRVEEVKHTPHRRWLLLDGGLADNPRPALYRARYSALPVLEPERPMNEPAWLAGPYCESGDILIEDLPMPDVRPGEWISVPVSGAYQLSMGSNYNGARRPAVLWLDGDLVMLIQRRETLEDLLRRDLPLPDASQSGVSTPIDG
jgi:diaminopimelate decarboxylase